MSIFHDPASLMQQARKQLQEKAPPTAKAERMVKDIKAGYSKDGLTDKEKAIAYATAWKAYNKTQKESHVVGKPAEKLGAVTSISKDEQEAAKQRTLAKAAALRKKREDQKEEFEIEEGMSLKDFKANRRNIKRREVSADAEKRGHVSKNIVTHGRKYSPDEAKSGRANMSDYERSVRKSVAMNPDQVGDTEESSDKTKNPKKLRKQKAMGELGEQSYQIDTAAHKSAQKIEKIRNLASGTNNANEKNAAMRKLSGPSLPLANSFEPEIINHLIENGFAETEQNALKIMENMSESWSEEIITELNRLEREQGKESGGNPDKAYQHVKKMIRGMEGKPPGQRKKQRGGATPGPNTTPAQKVAKRRAAAQQSQDNMSSRFD